ncbi:hypothetical protein [Streptomyces sp. NPDC059009]|uniref:hypothetical protein n=1 Tax=Streptomyces sp. NPDC059009 TaxID=3346694 RepID=UPI0036922015
MPAEKKKSRTAVVATVTLAAVAAAGGAVAFAGPGLRNSAFVPDAVSEHVFKEKTKSFATAADAPRKGDLAFVLPEWMPKDAKNIKVKVRTTGDAKLIRFTLGAESLPGDGGCKGKYVDAPDLGASWWRDSVIKKSRPQCGDHLAYRVAVQGKQVYAWTNGELAPRSDSGDAAQK